VVAAHDRDRGQALDPLDDGVRVAAVADQVAEHEGAIEAARAGVGEAGVEGLEVGVNVREHEIAH
jgi:hypothetical protein